MKWLNVFLGLCFFLFIFSLSLEPGTIVNLDKQNLAPSLNHFFGTDELGRDLFYRCLYALKISLFVGCAATVIDMIFGALFGALAALLKAPYSSVMSRFLDIVSTLPQMLLSIIILMIIKNGFYSLIIAISLTGWLSTARAVRAEMLKLKKMEFIKALNGLGFSSKTIILKHLLPSCLPTLFVSSALCLPSAIFSEAFMSFLGLGVRPPVPSLGNMIADSLPALSYYPWRLLFPAGMIFVLIFCLQQVIDRLKIRLGKSL